jgi:hypothetical protein
MGLPKRLRMGRAEYITISTQRLGDMTHGATITGPDMADIILNSQLSDTEQHLSLFGSLLTVIIERLRMFGLMKRGISTGHLDAIASDLFAILTVNGMYRPVRRAAAVRFFQLGPEPPRHLQWWNLEEYGQVQDRRERGRRGGRLARQPRSGRRPRRLRLVVGAHATGNRKSRRRA